MSGQPPLPMVGEVLEPAPTPSDGPHGQPAGAGSGLVAIRAYDGLTASDNALLDVLRDLERDRAQAADAARSVVRALAATLQARDGYTGDHADAVQAALDRRRHAARASTATRSPSCRPSRCCTTSARSGSPTRSCTSPARSTTTSCALMRTHPVIGERILSAVPGLEQVARAVRHEHERWDGAGYPDGLAGEEIPLASRIVLACDAWHAIVSDRPYRAALEHEAALAELRRCAGTQFDPGGRRRPARCGQLAGPARRSAARTPAPCSQAPSRTASSASCVALIVGRHRRRRGAPDRRRARGRRRGGARRDRGLVAVDRALAPRAGRRPHADQRRRSGARRAAPPRRRDLPARGRRRDARRDQARRHAFRLARRSRPPGHRARAAGRARQALLRRRADHVRRRGLGADLGQPAPRTGPASAPATRASCTRSAVQIGGAIGRAEVFSQVSELARPRRPDGPRQPARVRREPRARAPRGAARRLRPRARDVRPRQPQGHQRPQGPRGRRRGDPRRRRRRSPRRPRRSPARSSAASAATSSAS